MNPTPSLEISRFVRAPRSRVFEAWIDADQRKAWFVPAPGYVCAECEIDAHVGGRYRILLRRPDDAGVVEFTGHFTEIDPPATLAFTWTTRKGPQATMETIAEDSRVRVEFRENDEGTEVIVRHERLERERDGHGRGWTGCLESLAMHMSPEEIGHAEGCNDSGCGSDRERG